MRRAAELESVREWIAPGTAFVFSVLMALLAPRYPGWFGETLPAFTQRFLAFYPLWIALSTAALIAVALSEQIPPLARRAVWRALDVTLTAASILIIACGVIALFLPIFTRAEPY